MASVWDSLRLGDGRTAKQLRLSTCTRFAGAYLLMHVDGYFWSEVFLLDLL